MKNKLKNFVKWYLLSYIIAGITSLLVFGISGLSFMIPIFLIVTPVLLILAILVTISPKQNQTFIISMSIFILSSLILFEQQKIYDPRTWRTFDNKIFENNSDLVIYPFFEQDDIFGRMQSCSIVAVSKTDEYTAMNVKNIELYKNDNIIINNNPKVDFKNFEYWQETEEYGLSKEVFRDQWLWITVFDQLKMVIDVELTQKTGLKQQKNLIIPLKMINMRSKEWYHTIR